MPWPFPLSDAFSPPSYYCIQGGFPSMAFDASGNCHHRNNIFYVGDTVVIRTLKNTPNHYDIRDIKGNIVASGTPTFTADPWPDVTFGGGYDLNLGNSWNPGWYCIYFTGSSTDTNYGPAYGKTTFVVLRSNSNFPAVPTSTFSNFNFHPSGHAIHGPGESYTDAVLDDPFDAVVRSVLGMPSGRLSLIAQNNPLVPNGGSTDRLVDNETYMTYSVRPWLVVPGTQYQDPVRPRPVFMEFPNFLCTYDNVGIQNDGTQPAFLGWASAYPINTTINANNIYVECVNGTTGGTAKINIYYPNSSTLAESYDNLASGAAAETAINGVSSIVRVYNGSATGFSTLTKTVIGTVCRQAVATVVTAMAGLGVTHFEGPENEPTGQEADLVAHQYMLFQAALRDAGTSAKAIGPCMVNITDQLPVLSAFLDALTARGVTLDALSTHDYNSTLSGDINQGRNHYEALRKMLRSKGLLNIELWQTEATGGQADVMHAALHTPRRARGIMARILMMEQYGIPRERNPYWYDTSHGFWGDTGWIINDDHSLQPQAVLMNVLCQETFGMNHHHRMDFGSVEANQIFIGSVYGQPLTGSVAVIQCMSAMPSSQVVLSVTGTTSSLTVVNSQGVTSSVTPSAGLITVTTDEFPTYVRLPAGVMVSVYSVRDWAHNPSPSVSIDHTVAQIGGVDNSPVADGEFFNYYSGNNISTTGIGFSQNSPPDTSVVQFGQSLSVERVLVFTPSPYQFMPALTQFTVDTWDGASWTTRNSINTSPPSSFLFGDPGATTGTTYEQFWDEQWIHDVKLTGGPITCQGVRVSATSLSFGGAVDANALLVSSSFGASTATPMLAIQEIQVISPTSFTPGVTYANAVLADSPVAYYKLGEAAGATTAVSQVNAPTVNLAVQNSGNGMTFGEPPLATGDTATSLLNAPSASGYLSVANNAVLNVGDTFTLEFWLNATSLTDPTTRNVIQKVEDSGGASYQVSVGDEGAGIIALYRSHATGQLIAKATTTLVSGATYHCVVTKSGSTVHWYLNGVDVTGTVTNQTCQDTTGALVIDQGGAQQLGHVAIYSTALSSARVSAHYLAGISPSIPVNLNAPVIQA